MPPFLTVKSTGDVQGRDMERKMSGYAEAYPLKSYFSSSISLATGQLA